MSSDVLYVEQDYTKGVKLYNNISTHRKIKPVMSQTKGRKCY